MTLPATFTRATLPATLWVEGFEVSGAVRDVELKLTFIKNGSTVDDDTVRVTVVSVDLDIDANHDNTITDADDPIEAHLKQRLPFWSMAP